MLPELYHAHHSRNLEDLPFWLDLAEKSVGPILELGCGTGRVLIPLAETGRQIFGIDHSLPMLRYAHSLANGMRPLPLLVAADMRSFSFNLRFALIIIPCNTFSTLDRNGQLACLNCAHQHLNPGGQFAFGIPNPDALLSLPAYSGPDLEDEFIHPTTGNPVQVSSSWRRSRHTFSVRWMYDHLLPDGKVERFTTATVHQLAPAETYLDEVREAGFTITHLYGDFDGSDFRRESPNVLCICSAINY